MEFLRFGSSIPGTYWGCCAIDIIQNFNVDPDAPYAIQLVSGDGGGPITQYGECLYLGKTYREVFQNRMRIGTFSKSNMPNHAFIVTLTEYQTNCNPGKKWLAILKEEGFEFIRAVDNSVYSGPLINGEGTSHPNYIFGLFRNIGRGRIKDPYKPPEEWTKLPEATTQRELWQSRETKVYGESELLSAGLSLHVAGLRSLFPQQPKHLREEALAGRAASDVTGGDPFGEEASDDEEEEEYEDDCVE